MSITTRSGWVYGTSLGPAAGNGPSLASIRSSSRRKYLGVPAGSADQSGSFLSTASSKSGVVAPPNARLPASISYSTAPNEKYRCAGSKSGSRFEDSSEFGMCQRQLSSMCQPPRDEAGENTIRRRQIEGPGPSRSDLAKNLAGSESEKRTIRAEKTVAECCKTRALAKPLREDTRAVREPLRRVDSASLNCRAVRG